MTYLERRFRSYFGDEDDDHVAADRMREELMGSQIEWKRLNDELELLLSDRQFPVLRFVQRYANRWVGNSELEARSWILHVKQRLFSCAA